MEASELWVGFVGAGRMAGGLVRGLLQAGTARGPTGGSVTHGQGRRHGDSPGLAPSRRPCASCGAGKCGGTWGQRCSGRSLHSHPCCPVEGHGDSRVLTRSESASPPLGPCSPVQERGDNPVLARSQGPSPSPGPCVLLERHGDSPTLAYSQGPSPSPGSCPTLEGHRDSPFLPLFPGDSALLWCPCPTDQCWDMGTSLS